MRALVVLLALCAGCGGDDLCGGTIGLDTVCFTVHLRGNVDDGPIDSLQVDSTYNEVSGTSSGTLLTRRSIVGVDQSTSDMGSAGLPIAFPLVFQVPATVDETSRVTVVTLSRGNATGIGTTQLGVGQLNLDTPKPGSKYSVQINLTAASKADCFNPAVFGQSGVDKTDRTCGGTKCQACTAGKFCNYENTNCVYPLQCMPSASSYTCQ
jgi:hypothetical protein